MDIGGGTTGIAIVKKSKVTYSADEAPADIRISLTLTRKSPYFWKRQSSTNAVTVTRFGRGSETGVRHVGRVARHIEGQGITDLWLAGGSCMQPGVSGAVCKHFRRYGCIYRSTVCL